MFKKVNNWHLSILIIIVSVLSVSLVQKYVLAAWQEPTSVPGSIANQNIVLNPMTSNLDLNDKLLTGDNISIDPNGTDAISISNGSNLCLGATCKSSWPVVTSQLWANHTGGINYVSSTNPNVGIGTASPSELFHVSGGNALFSDGNLIMDKNVSIKALYSKGGYSSILYLADGTDDLVLAGDDINFRDLSGNSLVYIDDLGAIANVGIGTTTPNKSLSIATPSGTNAEINLISGTTNTHWGMYQDEATADLRFWHDNDNVVFDSAGYVGIGTTNPTSQLQVESASQTAVYAKANTAGKFALYAENTALGGTGVYGLGQFGVTAVSNAAGGTGLLAAQGTGNYAGLFFGYTEVQLGDLRIKNDTGNSYLHLDTTDVDPPSTDCDSIEERGRMIYNYVDNYLYVCDWDPAVPSGGGRKIYVQEVVPQ